MNKNSVLDIRSISLNDRKEFAKQMQKASNFICETFGASKMIQSMYATCNS